MGPILAIARIEFLVLRRNRWLAIATLVLAVFALALTFAGVTNSSQLGVDLLTVSVASMTTLAVYLVPLLALLMAFEAISGEAERGTLALILTYPVSRGTLLAGKFLAHTAGLTVAVVLGLSLSGVLAWMIGEVSLNAVLDLARLMLGSILLGAFFLAVGYALSAMSGSTAAAAGLAALVWLVLVVLYDLVLLGAIVWDGGGVFSRQVFPWLLVLNPADALRLFSVAGSAEQALATGMAGAAGAVPSAAPLASLLIWPAIGLGLARLAFGRRAT